jgi:hypothetical protein
VAHVAAECADAWPLIAITTVRRGFAGILPHDLRITVQIVDSADKLLGNPQKAPMGVRMSLSQDVGERAKLREFPVQTVFSGLKTAVLGAAGLLFYVACGGSGPPSTLTPEYDPKTGRLVRLRYDTNANGKVEIWSYMDGARITRIDIDKNEDGLVERWEHYGPPGNTLIKVGFSRAQDGIEDAWGYPGPDGTVARIEVATRRDGRVNRVEFYEKDVMVRVEEDTDGDGKPDKWERFDGGRLASVDLDTTKSGTPNRRLIHLPDGTTKLEHLGPK